MAHAPPDWSRVSVLVLPGLFDSGPEHWQTRWQAGRPSFTRVEQRDWEAPDVRDWIANLEAAVGAARAPVLLAAHSAACALVAHWSAAHPGRRVHGALLVAPSDPEAPSFPAAPRGFAPMPLARLPFPSTVVTSADDPYVAPARARAFAAAWGSALVDAGARGHLNSASGLGDWPEGLAQLAALARGG